jgi:hypothetical protein
MATDWEPYAEHMAKALEGAPGFTSIVPGETFAPRPDYRPLTKFESRGQRLGHGVWDLLYRRDSELLRQSVNVASSLNATATAPELPAWPPAR